MLARARAEIVRSWRETCELNRSYVAKHPQAAELFNPDKLPAFHDPFAGGGALPLEAQRLGLESYASDLNPVAVTINKAMIEIPPRFAGRKPVGPKLPGEKQSLLHEDWSGARGLAEDVRRYGAWMRAEAEKRVGHLYPKIEVTAAMVVGRPDLKPLLGQKLTVIAWLWARTVKSPNPAFSHAEVPLASTFVLSSKEGKEAYVEPVIDGDSYQFKVKVGTLPANAAGGTTAGKRAAFICLLSKSPIDYNHIRSEGKAGRMGQRLMAIVAEGVRGRVYLSPIAEQIEIARSANPDWSPEMELPNNPRDFKTPNYGLTKFGDLFTPRQLVALTTFSDLVSEAIERCRQDALAAWARDNNLQKNQGNAALRTDHDLPLDKIGAGATAYAQAVGVYLAFAVSKISNIGSSVASWMNDRGAFRETFARQAIPMVWDFAEANTFADAGGSFETAIDKGAMAVREFPRVGQGRAQQADASSQSISTNKVVSTDPPYYDNIGYADLSDFFYVWLRKSLKFRHSRSAADAKDIPAP